MDWCGFEAVKNDMFLCVSVDATTRMGMVRPTGYMCAWACGVVICSCTKGVRVISVKTVTCT